jgi:hypothetical protein
MEPSESERTRVAALRDEAYEAMRAAMPSANLTEEEVCSARLHAALPDPVDLHANRAKVKALLALASPILIDLGEAARPAGGFGGVLRPGAFEVAEIKPFAPPLLPLSLSPPPAPSSAPSSGSSPAKVTAGAGAATRER